MKILVDAQVTKRDLGVLIGQYRYGRYCEDPHLPLENSQRLELDRLQERLSSGNFHYFVTAPSPGQISGIILFRLSEWDTEHFGYKVVVIDSLITGRFGYEQEREIASTLLERFLAWCQSNGARFISVRIPSLDLPVAHSLEHWGFRYIENWIYNKYDLNKIDRLGKPAYQLRLAQPSDRDFMIEYSKGAFATHRFHADPCFEREKADSLYQKWIRTSFSDPHQEILVLDIDNSPVAFMIYYKDDLRAYFGLQFAMWKMAVLDPEYRGKGLGTDFFIALMYHHHRDGLDVVDSGLSMRNLPSFNLHNKLNFRVVSTRLTFHKWIE